jgi:hypothetical protein
MLRSTPASLPLDVTLQGPGRHRFRPDTQEILELIKVFVQYQTEDQISLRFDQILQYSSQYFLYMPFYFLAERRFSAGAAFCDPLQKPC